jgi:hypothetical protein
VVVGGRWNNVAVTEQPGSDADATESDEPAVLQTWTSPFGIERDKRMAELEAMPGFRLNTDLAALGRAGHIMYKNAEELVSCARNPL